MSSGSYLLSGHDGPFGVERFTCGAEGGGWRYDGVRSDPDSGAELGRISMLVERRVVRLEVTGGGWLLRGGVIGSQVLWRRGDDEREERADGFTGTSPAFAVAATLLVADEARRLRLVAVHDGALATSVVDQAWTPAGGGAWQVDDLATGERRLVRVEDGLVAAPGVTLTTP